MPCMFYSQGPKDQSYESKEWDFAVIDVSVLRECVYVIDSLLGRRNLSRYCNGSIAL